MTGTMSPLQRALRPAVAAAVLLLAPAAHAQTTTSTTRITLLSPLSVVNTAPLDFGQLAAGATAGTVTINANTGARTVTGGTVAAGGSPQRATFVAAGVINRILIVTVGGGSTTLTNGTGGTMTMNNLTLDGPTVRTFNSSGVATVNVGGRLNVGANQQPGNYTGTFSVTMVYP